MADLQAHIGRGGFERGRMMPPSTLLLERFVPAETARVSIEKAAARGALLQVNGATGNDANTRAQVRAGSAWATIGRAAWGSTSRDTPNTDEAAAPGDTVAIAAGTYSFSGVVNNRFIPVYNPANAGTAGNPVTFLATGTVTLTAPNTLSPVIGANKDYITWSGPFLLDEANIDTKADTGPVVFNGATGCVLEGVTLVGIPDLVVGDNHNGVRLEGAVNCTIRNCTIHDFWDGTSQNGTLITLYGSSNCIIEHNRGYNSGCAVYFKDTAIQPTQSGNHVRYNHFSDTTNSFFRWSHVSGGPVDRSEVYQNLCTDGWYGINFIGAVNDWVYNNTFVALAGVAQSVGGTTGVRVWNNIFEDCAQIVDCEGSTMPADTVHDSEHNCYHTYTTFYNGSDGSRTFASFKAAYTDQDQAAPASIDQDPLFVAPASGNYRLQAGSPARDLARHPQTNATMHAGCYQTGSETIGIEA